MNLPTLFIDRDGTLVEEPADQQVDRLEKVRLVPGVIPALLSLSQAGYRLVMVTNQDGLGTSDFPVEDFNATQDFIASLFDSQGIRFDAVLVCPHRPADQCACRKPRTGLVEQYLQPGCIQRDRSAVIGDRPSDADLASNMGITSFTISGDESWPAIARQLTTTPRRGRISRKTKETRIEVSVDLDAPGEVAVRTGIGFFDHMLEQLAHHGGFSLQLECDGDLEVDEHHTVEDCALALGAALKSALQDKRDIGRYGFLLPMDEALAQVALDLSGRAHLQFEGHFTREQVGGLPTELVPHFFRSLTDALGASLHLSLRGENNHHMIEAAFKGVGRALRQAKARSSDGIPSTKGCL